MENLENNGPISREIPIDYIDESSLEFSRICFFISSRWNPRLYIFEKKNGIIKEKSRIFINVCSKVRRMQ